MRFSTSKEIIDNKIDRNNLLIRILELRDKIIKIELVMRSRLLQDNTKKIQLIQEINVIENQQGIEYTKSRECQVARLTNLFNDPVDLTGLEDEMIQIRQQMLQCIFELDELNKKIPDTTEIINYKVNIM